jgi:hypothetical protein
VLDDEGVMPQMPEAPNDSGPKPSWRQVIFMTVAIAAIVAFYFWMARPQPPAPPRPATGLQAVSWGSAS